MSSLELSIQIVNYNTEKYLEPLLVSIATDMANSNIPYEILILDNASGDNLDNIRGKWKDRNVSLYTSDSNNGFGAGHNQLAKKANGKYLLLLNPDTLIIEERTISRLLKSLTTNNAGVIGGALVQMEDNSKGPIYLNDKGQLNLISQEWDHGELIVTKKDNVTVFTERSVLGDVAWVSGAALLIKTSIFNGVGGFDENFFLYKEEEDLCLRIRKNGHRVCHDPNIKILHFGSVVASKDKHFASSLAYYREKHGDEDTV